MLNLRSSCRPFLGFQLLRLISLARPPSASLVALLGGVFSDSGLSPFLVSPLLCLQVLLYLRLLGSFPLVFRLHLLLQA